MALPVIQPSFASGEISPQLFSRIDLAKVHTGAALLRNFAVDYRGGASNRPGTKFVTRAKDSSHVVRLIPFQYNVLQAYILEFGQAYMRAYMNGIPVTEPGIAISGITLTNPIGILVAASTFLVGDTVFITGMNGATQLNNRTFLVAAGSSTISIKLTDLDGNNIDGTSGFGGYTGGGTIARVFTLGTPYQAADLALLKFAQSADVMTLTHPNYKPQLLTRTQHYAWTMTQLTFSPKIAAPSAAPTVTPNTAGTTTYRYVVTALSPDQTLESLPTASGQTALSATMSATATAFNTVTWNAVAGAGGYNVYRQIEVPGGAPSTGALYGFVGTSLTTSLVDHNLTPNFSLTPPQGFDPFNKGSIISVPVTAGGAAYLPVPNTVINITDATGAGAQLFPTIAGGVITAVAVSNGGQLYTAPTFIAATRVGSGAYGTFLVTGGNVNNIVVSAGGSNYASNITWIFGAANGTWNIDNNGTILSANITVAASGLPNGLYSWTSTPDVIQTQVGAGATFGTAVLTSTGNNPGCVTYFQQRQIFGGSSPAPQTMWLSQSNDYFNMNFSTPAQDSDAMTMALVSREVNAIKWLIPMNSLIVLTGKNAWRVDGGSQSDVITPTKFNAVPQSFNGAADVPPLTISYDILYVQAKGSVVRDLSYNFYANIYTGADLTVLSNHLVKGRQITEWCWAEEPNKIIWAIRDDGVLLSLTYVKEQDVYGWAKHDTLGAFQSVATITEGQEDAVYFVVQRRIGNRLLKFIERLASREFQDDVMAAWFVDCATQNRQTFPNGTATPSSGWKDPGSEFIVLSSDTAVFGLSDAAVGNQVRINGGIGIITTLLDTKNVIVRMSHPMNNVFPAAPGTWSCTPPITEFTGLDYLTGQTVTGLADGSVIPPQVVGVLPSGSIGITLPAAASMVTVGLGYQAQLQTLYAGDAAGGGITVQGRRKGVPSVTARVHNSRGLKVGPDFENLYEFKERTDLPYMLPAPVGQSNQARIQVTTNLGDPVPLQSVDERANIDTAWTRAGQICFQQDYPLPCTITGVIPEFDIGDEVGG
jgi:hypothetical protein